MITYLDTSAAFKAVVREEETAALLSVLETRRRDGGHVVSSMLLFTDLHCAARRRRAWDPGAVNGLIDRLDLVDVDRDDLVRAGSSEWGLRSADAIHLATAVRVQADELVTYDQELAEAAERVGLRVVSPR